MAESYRLTNREQRFADEYIANGRNATQAYKAISPNAKDTTCASKGYEWIRKGEIARYIRDKTKERLDASNLTAQDVLDELIEIGFGKAQKGISRVTDNQTGEVIKDLLFEANARTEDRLKALELIGKNLTMWTDKQEIEHSGNIIFVDDVPLDDDD